MSAPTSTKVKPARSNAPSVKVAVDVVAVVAVVVVVVAVVAVAAVAVVVTVLPRRNKQKEGNPTTFISPLFFLYFLFFTLQENKTKIRACFSIFFRRYPVVFL